MRAHDPLVWVCASVAALIGGVTWGVWVHAQASGALAFAISTQLLGALVMRHVVRPERRMLALTLAASVPVIGTLAAAWLDGVIGEGGVELLAEPEPLAVRVDGLDIANRLGSSLPPCEALVARDVATRRATIARLSARASADDIAILRWARSQQDPEIAVEVALAFEDISQRFDVRLDAARARAASSPSFATHAEVVRVIEAGITSGLVDAAMIAKLASDARTHYHRARELAPSGDLARTLGDAASLVVTAARLELALRRPAAALELLTPQLRGSANRELVDLHSEAAYAARRFDLVPALPRNAA